jgi:hypothetical protein
LLIVKRNDAGRNLWHEQFLQQFSRYILAGRAISFQSRSRTSRVRFNRSMRERHHRGHGGQSKAGCRSQPIG